MGESHEERRLDQIIESIEHGNLKQRGEAITDLKAAFNRFPRANVDVLTDKSYHKIYEVLFKNVLVEKKSVLTAKKTTQAAASNRLKECGDAIRVVVKAGASKLKSKTVDAVVDHIIQVLPTTDGGYFELLADNYFKALSALFECPENAERLKPEVWFNIADFCLRGINDYLGDPDEESSGLSRPFSGLGTGPSSGSMTRTNSRGQNKPSSRINQNISDLFQTVLQLVSAPNAPLLERYTSIAESTMRYLQSQGSSVSQVHQTAFSILNTILRLTRMEQTAFSQSIACKTVPIMSRIWQGRSLAKDEMLNRVRDEMFIFMFSIFLHVERGLKDDKNHEIGSDLEELLDALRADYTARSERDQLQLDDLELACLDQRIQTSPFHLDLFQLRPHVTKAERNWALLLIIGILERLVNLGQNLRKTTEYDSAHEEDMHPIKRQRTTNSLDRMMSPLKAIDEKSRTAELQILPFVLQECQLSASELVALIAQLHQCTGDKRGNIASWALLAMACCATQNAATDLDPAEWTQLWHIGTRSLTFSTTCRAASLQLHTLLARQRVKYHDIGEDVNAIITAANANGPVVLCDSSISLVTHLLHATVTERPGSSLVVSQHVIRWFFTRWNPVDRMFASRLAVHIQPLHITNLVRTCLGFPLLPVSKTSLLPCGPVAQAWQHHLNTENVIRYLLLLKDTTSSALQYCSSCPSEVKSGRVHFVSNTTQFVSTRKILLEVLQSKCSDILQNWIEHRGTTLVSSEMIRSVTYGSICMLMIMAHLTNADSPQLQLLDSDISELNANVIDFLSDAHTRTRRASLPLIETLLQCIEPYLPPPESTCFTDMLSQTPHLLQFFVLAADKIEWDRNSNSQLSSDVMDDLMDIDDHFSSTPPATRNDSQHISVPRDKLSLEMWSGSFYRSVTGNLMLISARAAASNLNGHVPSVFVDYMVSLDAEDFLASSKLLKNILLSDLILDVEDATKITDTLTDVVSSDLYARCESVWMMCIDALVALGPLWSKLDGSLITEWAQQMYEHIIIKVLGKKIASPTVQRGISELLFFLMRVNEEYGCDLDLPSPRTILLTILQESNVSVKFYIGRRLSQIFKLYVLSEHENVFIDILNHLPKDPERIEEINLRQYVFATLASSWPTLLRRCIYNIFEGAGKIPECIDQSTKCLEDISSALKLDSPQELFTLFAPQILYTWLVEENIKDIPFVVFGFPTLRELIEQAQDEATAIMAMRGQDSAIKELASLLEITEHCLLERSFAKVIAYNTAYTTSTPPPVGGKHVAVEAGLKRQLGTERFFECLGLRFTDIIATLFIAMDPEKNMEKYLLKAEFQREAAEIIGKMKGYGAPKSPLPQSQQPAFKARFLCKEIEHVCSRSPFAVTDLYTPTLVTYAARSLFNTIHPALGSLHACSVLQKVRVLIALAGPSAVQEYPLEMLIQAVAPFLADPECADDAIGMLQYLIQSGSKHLSQAPRFVAGTALSVFGSLASLLDVEKVSSQYKAARTKAQAFHAWLGQYLNAYNPSSLRPHLRPGFRTLIESAFNTTSSGNSELDTAESQLLIQLLNDERTGGEILDRPSREMALGRLSSNFRLAPTFRSDVLGTDDLSIDFSTLVWKSCRGAIASREYLSWAARVTGRAFAASGQIHEELLQESSLSEIKTILPKTDEDLDSESSLIYLLRDLTLGKDSHTAGLAEAALRLVLSTADAPLLASCGKCIPMSLYNASLWPPFQISPSATAHLADKSTLLSDVLSHAAILEKNWTQSLSLALARSMPGEALLSAIVPILQHVAGFAERVFPFVIHLVLSARSDEDGIRKRELSAAFGRWFNECTSVDQNSLKMLLNAVLYLRTQALPREKSSADRAHWLNIDYLKAGTAATHCGMFKTALFFIEEFCSQPTKSSRRSSNMKDHLPQGELPNETLLTIFENIDDPDLYYGVKQTSSLKTILSRFEYERDGSKSLAFRGAQYDSHIRRHDAESNRDAQSLVKALDVLNLSGLSHSLLQAQQSVEMNETSVASMFQTARKLERWDIPIPNMYDNGAVTMYKAFQGIHTATDEAGILHALNEGLEHSMTKLAMENLGARSLHETLQTLAVLVEMDEVFTSRGSEQFEDILFRFRGRDGWMKTGNFDDISHILSCRGTTLSTLSQDHRLQTIIGVETIDTRLVEVNAALMASKIHRSHDALQEALSLATSMTDLISSCSQLGIKAEVAIHIEAANALWDQGEMGPSIRMLQALDDAKLLKSQTITVGRSQLLSTIGQRVSFARLEKADHVIARYLEPSLTELRGANSGSEAAEVFHQFALFCDQQLQDPDGIEDLERLRTLSKNKEEEVKDYDKLIKNAKSQDKIKSYKSNQDKAKKWLKMDLEELKRHMDSREQFLRRCLENYLLALMASDDHNHNALRFSSLWFQHSDEKIANDAVSRYMQQVPSRKFAPLMNQLSSRLQKYDDQFQHLLFDLVFRVCTEHPYHGMYHIYAGVNTKANANDQSATLRMNAAHSVAESLERSEASRDIWSAIKVSNEAYCRLAGEKDGRYKASKKFSLKDSNAAIRFGKVIAKYRVPPPTMSIELSPTMDYSKVPVMVRLEPQFTIASGVSAPKIITANGDNGVKYKQLVKGGTDDLRQDAIMEQVFEQVSELLKTNKSTRQRNLHIRTYRVIPLTPNAGVIEFVADTIPLHDYLLPAHERYYPKDWRGSHCRTEIGDVQFRSTETRIKAFRNATEHFHPVMRHFFTEKFHSPDEWFIKRLAYTRSTAAISILGHVVGLGDRHGHNILLDAKNGEVVHIDLGIAFEMGRVLPIPETVPFRLTRDIVDGMGITKTEGVFRRCCEFTLEALRKETYSIMTILEVLRYDPLYSWSISPVRLAKLQEAYGAAAAAADGTDTPKERVSEPGEAERSLEVVRKKLSKTLSVTATVNDLINQASDEKNLATLFSGWAAYV